MPRSKRKSKDFVRDVEVRRAKREVRDEVFDDIMVNSYNVQREKLRNWIYEQVEELKAILAGLECLAHDDVGRGVLEFAGGRLGEIEATFGNTILNLGPKDNPERPREIELEEALAGLNTLVMPIVKELMYLRRLVDFVVDVTP